MPIKLPQHLPAHVVAVLFGVGSWIYLGMVSHRREAWDDPVYFQVCVPAIALMAAALAFLYPEMPKRWGYLGFAGQAVTMIAKDPTGNLLPLGLIFFAILGALCSLPAILAAWIRRSMTPRPPVIDP